MRVATYSNGFRFYISPEMLASMVDRLKLRDRRSLGFCEHVPLEDMAMVMGANAMFNEPVMGEA